MICSHIKFLKGHLINRIYCNKYKYVIECYIFSGEMHRK